MLSFGNTWKVTAHLLVQTLPSGFTKIKTGIQHVLFMTILWNAFESVVI